MQENGIDSTISRTMPYPDIVVDNGKSINEAVMSTQPQGPRVTYNEQLNINVDPEHKWELDDLTADQYTIQKMVGDVQRGVTVNPGISLQTKVTVNNETANAPNLFPGGLDPIKSLVFSSNDMSQKSGALTTYYALVLQLLNKDISVNDYYAKMPQVIESVQSLVLTETDWENLRDAILRVQNYILTFLWGDMQKISKAMDDGFAKYQKNINDWIVKVNTYHSSDNFLPQDTVALRHLNKVNNPSEEKYELAQNMWDLVNGMTTRVSTDKPVTENTTGKIEKNFPTNKGLVWIELLP